VIYPVDTIIHILNNLAQLCSVHTT